MIYTILKNTVESLHQVIDVTLQTDESDGTYTLTLTKVWLIRLNGFVLGSNGTKYQVNSITGLVINITKADADVLTTVQCLQPYFYSGGWQDYSNHLLESEKQYQEDKEILPSVFLITGYSETDNPIFDSYQIQIMIDDYTDDLTNEDRETNEIPYLKTLRDEVIHYLNRNPYVINLTDISYQKIYDVEYDTISSGNRIPITLNITHHKEVEGC